MERTANPAYPDIAAPARHNGYAAAWVVFVVIVIVVLFIVLGCWNKKTPAVSTSIAPPASDDNNPADKDQDSDPVPIRIIRLNEGGAHAPF